MYGIFTYTYHKHHLSVGIYTIPMDPYWVIKQNQGNIQLFNDKMTELSAVREHSKGEVRERVASHTFLMGHKSR